MVNDTDAQLLNLKNNILSYDSEALTHVCKLILHKHASRFPSFPAHSLNALDVGFIQKRRGIKNKKIRVY